MRRRRDQRGGVPSLGAVDQIDRRIVADQGEEAGDRRLGAADRLAHIGERRLPAPAPPGIEQPRFRRGERGDLATVAPIDRPRFDREISDRPAPVLPAQRQVDDAEMAAPETGHHGRNTIQRAPSGIDARQAGIIRAGEDAMLMAGEEDINARQPAAR
ncbi:MAG: hypothetical protein WDN69_02840 [Aliidongia sp.]